VPAAGFADWLGKTRAAGGRLDGDAYGRLAKPSAADKPATFGAVAPRMFEAISHDTVK
jgi:cytochrome o ubiquinol oxidase subunit 2